MKKQTKSVIKEIAISLKEEIDFKWVELLSECKDETVVRMRMNGSKCPDIDILIGQEEWRSVCLDELVGEFLELEFYDARDRVESEEIADGISLMSDFFFECAKKIKTKSEAVRAGLLEEEP